MPPSPADIAEIVRAMPREEKLRLIAEALTEEQDRRRERAALPAEAADGSLVIRMRTRDGPLVFRLSAEDLAL